MARVKACRLSKHVKSCRFRLSSPTVAAAKESENCIFVTQNATVEEENGNDYLNDILVKPNANINFNAKVSDEEAVENVQKHVIARKTATSYHPGGGVKSGRSSLRNGKGKKMTLSKSRKK